MKTSQNYLSTCSAYRFKPPKLIDISAIEEHTKGSESDKENTNKHITYVERLQNEVCIIIFDGDLPIIHYHWHFTLSQK